jgi:hypothetical protein
LIGGLASLLFFPDAAHLNLGASLLLLTLFFCGRNIIVVGHELTGFLIESTVASTFLNLEVGLGLLRVAGLLIIIFFSLLVVFTHNLLLLAFSVLLLFAVSLSFFFLLTLSVSFGLIAMQTVLLLCLDAHLFVFFRFLRGLLFLFALFVSFYFRKLLLALLLFDCSLGVIIFICALLSLLSLLALLAILLSDAEDLHNVWSCVDAGSSSSKHLLQEKVSVFGFVTSNNFGWFAVNLLAHY